MSEVRYRAGMPVEDRCRVCKELRGHTVIVVDGDGRPLRVICNYCQSQHNYRGGDARRPSPPSPRAQPEGDELLDVVDDEELVSEGEIIDSLEEVDPMELEKLLRRIIREEAGLTAVAPAAKWRGGEMILRPAKDGVQEYSMPIETFFRKIISVRNKLRVLEQQVNATDEIPDEVKLKLQGYISGAYGSLTSFNQLFAEEKDKFK